MKKLHPKLKGYRAFIFDIDDTLVLAYDILIEVYAESARRLGYTNSTVELLQSIWGKPLRVVFPEIFPGINLERYLEVFYEVLPEVEHAMYPGARDLLDHLIANEIEIGAVTAGELRRIFFTLDRLDMQHYFPDRIYGSNNLEYTKPDPRSLDPLVNEFAGLGITLDQIAMSGDSIHDYHAARDRGVDFYAVCTGLKSREDFIEAGLAPEMIFDRVGDFLV